MNMLAFFAALGLVGCAAPTTMTALSIDLPRSVETVRGDVGERAHEILRTAAAAGFSGAAIIEIDGAIVFAGGYGWADREARQPFTIDTVAQIGSITKPFTGAAIADLVRRGLVDVDQTAGHYLPGAAEPGASVTLRQLLSHRSGMREYCGDDFDARSAAEVRSVCMALPLDQQLADSEGAAYSNVGYSVLGAIVERVSGESLEEYVAARLLAPAGIGEDGYGLGRNQRRRLAAGYMQGVRNAPISERIAAMGGDYWNLKGNGGMQLSARAMYRWHQALTCRAPMDPALRELILHPIVEPGGNLEAGRGTLVSYGYGWAFRTTPNGAPFKQAHGGSDGVFLAQYIWRPYDRVFLYVVGNIGEDDVRPTTVELRRLIGDSVQLTDADIAGRADPWRCAG
ncbi:MAG: serine hydrolase domain-containing protein [Hyphomonadaceae bacterium]